MENIYAQSGKAHFHCARAASFGMALFAALPAGNFYCGTALAAIHAAPAGKSINLNGYNIYDYLETDEKGIDWLKSAGGQKQHYKLTGFASLDTLGLNAADTALIIDTRQSSETDRPVLFIDNILHVENGSLHIIAADSSPVPAENAGRTNLRGIFPSLPTPPPQAVGFGTNADQMTRFIQTGGSVTIQAQDNALAVNGGNSYDLQGGEFSVYTQDEAIGIELLYSNPGDAGHNGAEALFRQTGGQVIFDAKGDSTGLRSNQSAEISGGRLQIHAVDQAQAILLRDSDTEFRQKGGIISIKAEDNSTGLETAKFRMEGGLLHLQSSDSARAVYISSSRHEDGTPANGEFLFKSGLIHIAQGSKAAKTRKCDGDDTDNYAVYGDDDSHAVFGKNSVLRPVMNIGGSGGAVTGRMSFGTIHIEPQAKLDMMLINSYKLISAAPITLNFLESREAAIDGNFTDINKAQKRKLFYDYESRLSDNKKQYQLRLRPKSKNGAGGAALRVSDIARGNNKRAAAAIENTLLSHKAGAQNEAFRQKLGAFYDRLYNSNLGEEKQIESRLRHINPYQATRLPALSLNIQEYFADDFRHSVTQFLAPGNAGQETMADKAANEAADLWAIWLKPAGSHDKYRAQNSSFKTLTADYGGLNFGAAAHYGKFALGLAGGFDSGRLHGEESYHADMRHFLLGGGLAYAWHLSDSFHPVLDMNFSYGNGRFKQYRRDSLNISDRSHIRQNSFMASAALTHYYGIENYGLQFAPQLGLDYAYIHQNAYTEKGGGLPLRVKGTGFNALRPKIGGAALWNASSRLAMKTYAYYRYDILDINIDLDTQMRDAAAVAWKTKGEDSARSSANAGVKLAYYMRPDIVLNGAYDLSAQGERTAQQFSARARIEF